MGSQLHGAILDHGPTDWQIIQRDAEGKASIPVSGRWTGDAPGEVEVAVVSEETGVPVARHLACVKMRTGPNGTWSGLLQDVPEGGLYRLETRYNPGENKAGEWSDRGDMRHFIGIGDLWVIAGQSNAAGYGRAPYYDAPELGIHMFRNSEEWGLASHPLNESTASSHLANCERANPGHSPYLHFARLLRRELGIPIGLIPAALGGSPLSAWNPTETSDAVLFENMVQIVKKTGGKVTGILWYQGESDTGTEEAASSYKDRFMNAVRCWRVALGSPGLPVLTVQLNRMLGQASQESDVRWSSVREAQRQIPGLLQNVAVVPALDCVLSDGIHNSPASNMLLGERLARAALAMVYGRPVPYLAPDVRSATCLREGKEIELQFDNVTSRIESADLAAVPFVVEDVQGRVPVRQVAYHGDNRVSIILGRPVGERAVVHGGFGADPPAVPMDMERQLPMLGFYGLPVRPCAS